VETTRCTIWVYLRKHKLNKDGRVPLLMRVTINGRRWDSMLKVRINPNDWDPIKEKATKNDSFSKLRCGQFRPAECGQIDRLL